MSRIKLMLLVLLVVNKICGQGVRMHYSEFTNSQRLEYINAINTLAANGIIEQYADYHADPNQDGITGNTTGGDDNQIHFDEDFLPWHRWFLIEFESELRALNPNVSIPYWDWTGASDETGINSRSVNSPLWSNTQISELNWTGDFLNDFNIALALNRTLGSLSTLPSGSEVFTTLNLTNFTTFREQLEFSGPNLHGRPHVWVGGEMSNILYSPRDPIFYFHHAMVDKIWQDWTEMGNNSSFGDNNMPTFNGSVNNFPNINPNTIIDLRELGIFYSDAINSEVYISNYTVTNNNYSEERFIYNFEIIVENFVIPTNKNASFISPTGVTIVSTFVAEVGSTFEILNHD